MWRLLLDVYQHTPTHIYLVLLIQSIPTILHLAMGKEEYRPELEASSVYPDIIIEHDSNDGGGTM